MKTIFVFFILSFLLIGCSPTTYNICFADYNNTIIQLSEIKKGEAVIPPQNPSRVGYNFVGWDRDFSQVENNLTIKAKYKPLEYTISLDEEPNSSSDKIIEIDVKYDEVVKLPIPTKEWYNFKGWKLNGNIIPNAFKYQYLDNIYLTAEWEEITDPLYPEVNDMLKEVDNLLNNTNDFRMSMIIDLKVSNSLIGTIQDREEAITIINKQDNYCEAMSTADGEISMHTIIHEIDDKIYLEEITHQKDQPSSYETQYLGDISETPFLDPFNYTSAYSSRMIFSKIDENHYQMKGKLGDIDNGELKEMYEMIGLNFNDYKNMQIIIEIKFDSEKQTIQIKSIIDQPITINYVKFDMKVEETILFDKMNNTTQTNLDTPEYVQNVPHDINNVTKLTDITQPLVCPSSFKSYFYKIHFTQGQYIIHTSNVNQQIVIYDENKQEINLGPFFNQPYIHDNIFIINEGTYYIEVKNVNLNSQTIFEKVNFRTLYDINNPITISPKVSGTIEGLYDAVIYQYISNEKGILDITNADPSLSFYYQYSDSLDLSLSQPRENHIFIPIDSGINKIYLLGSEEINYTFSTKFIADTISSTNIDEMNLLTDQYTSDYLVMGNHFNPDYFRLEITQPGEVVIDFDIYTGTTEPLTLILYENGDSTLQNDDAMLEIGTYYVEFKAKDRELSIVKVKYHFIPDTIIEKPFAIQNYDGTTPEQDIPVIEETLTAINIRIYHKFYLDNLSTIFISVLYDYELLNESNQNILIHPIPGNEKYFKLPSGEYRIRIKMLSSVTQLSYKLQVARVIQPINDDYIYPESTPLLINQTFSITNNYYGDLDVFSYDFNESGVYVLSLYNANIMIYDANWEFIYNYEGTDNYNIAFDKGTYYFVSGNGPKLGSIELRS